MSLAICSGTGGHSMLALMTDAFGGYGGIAQYNRDFLLGASRSGLFQSILVLPRIGSLGTGELPSGVRQVGAIKGQFRYAACALVSALRHRPTVIFNAHLYHAPLSFLLARLTGAKLISQLHGTEVWKPIPRSCRTALEASDLILTVSRDTRARLLAQIRIVPEKVVVLNNTFDDAFGSGDRRSARHRLGLGDEFVILTVSRLDGQERYKGQDRIIRQLPTLRDQGCSVSYLVAGTGQDRERLQRLAEELGVAQSVRFLGMVSPEDLPDLYRAADLFALPSMGEGFGIAFVEAMACGTPAIGLAVGGATDALGNGSLGVCVAPEAFPAALAAALQQRRAPDTDLAGLVRERFGRNGFDATLASQLVGWLAPDSGERYRGRIA